MVDQRDAALLEDGRLVETLDLGWAVMHFVTLGADNRLQVSVFREDAEGPRQGGLWQLGSERLSTYPLTFPSGVLGGETTWVADYRRGELHRLSNSGESLTVYGGLKGPMGLTRAPNGDLCVAEMLAGRIRCFSLEVLRQK